MHINLRWFYGIQKAKHLSKSLISLTFMLKKTSFCLYSILYVDSLESLTRRCQSEEFNKRSLYLFLTSLQFKWSSWILEKISFLKTYKIFLLPTKYSYFLLKVFLIRVYQKSTFFEIKDEYPWKLFLLGHWYWIYKFFHSNPLFSSSPGFLTVLHPITYIQYFNVLLKIWRIFTCEG